MSSECQVSHHYKQYQKQSDYFQFRFNVAIDKIQSQLCNTSNVSLMRDIARAIISNDTAKPIDYYILYLVKEQTLDFYNIIK